MEFEVFFTRNFLAAGDESEPGSDFVQVLWNASIL